MLYRLCTILLCRDLDMKLKSSLPSTGYMTFVSITTDSRPMKSPTFVEMSCVLDRVHGMNRHHLPPHAGGESTAVVVAEISEWVSKRLLRPCEAT